MKIQIEPISKFSASSKLAFILKHLDWTISNDESDVSLWITDGRQPDALFYNWRLVALNKQVVNDTFKSVFGYDVGVDPEIHVGKAVEKRLDHGVHGQVVNCPKPWLTDRAYQKLMRNRKDGWMDEYRLDIFRSESIVTLKHQLLQKNGMPQERRVDGESYFDVPTDDCFSKREQSQITEFCAAIGLDYGGVDIVRHEDGRLYIIDATTNVGMPEMSWHKNLLLDEYICRQATAFERNLTPLTQTP